MIPKSIYVCDDSEKDTQYVREQALAKGEEHTLANSKQTIHWDGYGDQARDKKNTRFMVYKENMDKMASLNSVEYEEGLGEVMGIAKGIMKGKDAVVLFYSEGPTRVRSPFLACSSPIAGTLLTPRTFCTALHTATSST